ncbi:MAG: hypothetical protein C0606_09430 [Hyphomicrobiales bacterium]|nr:MAG: hypothetical protein C0606_09430 [Hyphomicrobiales bacterium]
MRLTLGAAVVVALSAGAALAEDEINCAEPYTQYEMTYCAEKAWKAVDRDLNYTYKMALYAMEVIDNDLPPKQRGAAKALRDAQRLWIKFRDKVCEAEGFQARGGTMEPMLVYQCYERLTKQQYQALDAIAAAN